MTNIHDNGRDGDEPFDGEDRILDNDSEIETEAEELSLVDDDEPLPWLESDYDDEDEGVDTGRLIGFGLLLLLAGALLIAAVWWFSRPSADPELVADGSTIEAPDGPTKERPEDAGGKEFEGTGNVAPQVGEGLSGEARLARDNAAARPSVDAATPENTGSGAAGAGNTGSTSSSGSVGVQVGAFGSRDRANQAWGTLSGQTQALKGFKHRVVEGQVDGATVFRLQAVAGDAAAASKLCRALKADGIACQVKK